MTRAPKATGGEIRIIGGVWRRSRLPVLDLPGLRPTGDRLRETLFNWLGQELGGWCVLDAFAGSGALGLEAASRGAGPVRLVERDARAAASLRQQLGRLQGASGRVRVDCGDAFVALREGPYDLILLDPPFEAELFERALAAAAQALAENGRVYLEAPREFAAPPGLRLHRHLRAGATHAHLFVREPDPARASP